MACFTDGHGAGVGVAGGMLEGQKLLATCGESQLLARCRFLDTRTPGNFLHLLLVCISQPQCCRLPLGAGQIFIVEDNLEHNTRVNFTLEHLTNFPQSEVRLLPALGMDGRLCTQPSP
jgi:hypothetical protein